MIPLPYVGGGGGEVGRDGGHLPLKFSIQGEQRIKTRNNCMKTRKNERNDVYHFLPLYKIEKVSKRLHFADSV